MMNVPFMQVSEILNLTTHLEYKCRSLSKTLCQDLRKFLECGNENIYTLKPKGYGLLVSLKKFPILITSKKG